MSATQVSEPQPPQPPQPPHSVAIWLKLKVQTGCRLFVLPFLEPSAVAMMSGERDAGSARRRRWLRHERMTVAAELSAALHHSRDGEREQYVGLRAQKSDSAAVVEEVVYVTHAPPPGSRRAPLPEVAGPQAAVTVGFVAAELLRSSLLRWRSTTGSTTPVWTRRASSSSSTSLSCRRRRSSRSSLFSRPQSFPSCCTFQVVDAPVVLVVLAMPRSCRLRHFAPMAGYAGCDAPRLCSSWLLQGQDLRHLGRYDQKDSCSGMFKAGIACDNAPCAVFSSLVRRPMMLCIVASMNQKDSCPRSFTFLSWCGGRSPWSSDDGDSTFAVRQGFFVPVVLVVQLHRCS